jgi:hypothetical protein
LGQILTVIAVMLWWVSQAESNTSHNEQNVAWSHGQWDCPGFFRRNWSWATQEACELQECPWHCQSFSGCCDKAPKIGDIHNRNVLSYNSEVLEWKFKVNCSCRILLWLFPWFIDGHFLPLTLHSLLFVHNHFLIFLCIRTSVMSD